MDRDLNAAYNKLKRATAGIAGSSASGDVHQGTSLKEEAPDSRKARMGANRTSKVLLCSGTVRRSARAVLPSAKLATPLARVIHINAARAMPVAAQRIHQVCRKPNAAISFSL